MSSARTEALAIRTVWYAASISVLAAIAAMLSFPMARPLAIAVGLIVPTLLMARLRARTTPFLAATASVAAAVISMGVVISTSPLPWRTGISWSQAGGVGQSTAWLFAVSSLCFGAGVLASGHLMLGARRTRGMTRLSYRLAAALPWVSFTGFFILALFPVGGPHVFAVAHNYASWAALGAFWAGMIGTIWDASVTTPFRIYSGLAAVLVFGTWLPNGLRFLGFIDARPISMLAMEIVVFPLCLAWFCWLAWEWTAPD